MGQALARWSARPWAVFGVLLLFALAVRAITFNNPFLEWDEQWYLLVGDQMVNHHASPYIDIFDRKPVGLFLIYAAIRELGGGGFLEYKLVACGFVAAAASLIYRAALPISNRSGALCAALIYVVWLNFLEGEGGQSPIFYNPLMIGAALLTWSSVEHDRRRLAHGCLAMFVVGLSIQIKYTVLYEGVFFGLVLLWGRWRASHKLLPLITHATLWAGLALLPTVLVGLWYWHIGGLNDFVFANFYSIFGRNPQPRLVATVVAILATIVLAPLALLGWLGGREAAANPRGVWVYYCLWALASLAGVILFGAFLSKHYALPIVAPLSLLTAPYFARMPQRRGFAMLFIGAAAILSQASLWSSANLIGDGAFANQLAKAAQPRSPNGCIYVTKHYAALYMLTHSCLLTKWAFPSHLIEQSENNMKATGVDAASEIGRILDKKPEVVVDMLPRSRDDNLTSLAELDAVIIQKYHLTASFLLPDRDRVMVYRLNGLR